MLIITDRLTVGQITFVLRVAAQILSYGGLFLIVRLLLTGAPRVASLRTHDIVNRVVSSSAFTLNSVRWILDSFRLKTGDLVRPPHLLFCVVLFTLYGPFVSLSDIGLLGLFSCSVPAHSSFLDHPASITTADQARSALTATLLGGADPATINAYRCDSVEVVGTDSDSPFRNCTTWHNSTYVDSTFFTGINMTDSAALVPLQLRKSMNITNMNSYYVGPETRRIEMATVRSGILVDPHETGFRAVFGVPALTRDHQATLEKTMALEVDVGCMESGIYTSSYVDSETVGNDLFATNGSWRKYSGPDYLRNVLSKTVDKVREYSFPKFNKSTIDQDGFMQSFNISEQFISSADSVTTVSLDISVDAYNVTRDIFGNCTHDLNQQLMLTPHDHFPTFSCNMLGIGGQRLLKGYLYSSFSRMVCATTTQVNMVSATVQMDAQGDVTLQFTRLPSDLNYIKAGDWRAHIPQDGPLYFTYDSVERYVLQDNPSSPTNHYVTQDQGLSDPIKGLGSGSTVFSSVGTNMITPDESPEIGDLALNVLGHNDATPLNASTVTRWAGQIGASYILGSIAYNGWVALSSEPILVTSTGSTLATCYKPLYAIGFFPLIASAIIVITWTTALYLRKRLTGLKQLERLYDGMNPFAQVLCREKETLLIWQGPESHLEVISLPEAVAIGGKETALGYLMSEPELEPLEDHN